MSDALPHRRQPPSPLVFSSDNLSTATSVVASLHSQPGGSRHGSGSNTVSMPFVRRHVTRRLKTAKAECDKELQRITNNITTFFEDKLREGEFEREFDRDRDWNRERDHDSQLGDMDHLQEPFVFHPSDLRSALQADESSSDGGYEAELEMSHYTHHRALSTTNSPHSAPTLAHWSSSPGLLAASSAQSLSPSLRRQSTLPWERERPRPLDTSASSSTLSSSPATSTAPLSDFASSRRQPNVTSPASWASQSMSSRRLSRSIPMPVRATPSGQSSRSTSRSRSPMPPGAQPSFLDSHGSAGPVNRRSSRLLVDDPLDPIMSALYDLIGVATDVLEMSLNQLTTQPKLSELIVQRVQNIGKAWEEHPEWPGRNWYVQVLLAIASLSRVVEWWEAEKQFWNFDDNDEDEDEPLAFVTKPADEWVPTTVDQLGAEMGKLKLTSEDSKRPQMSRPSSQGRKFGGERLSTTSPPPGTSSSPPKALDHNESARVLATERLRLQAEMAQNQNIVVELSLDGDHFVWVNYAWRVVVGTNPDELPGTRISRLLAPSDLGVFKEATQRLQEDDSHTVEVRFRLEVEPEIDRGLSTGTLYQQMEGKGMLMVDREDGLPSHTMWVVKPIAPAKYESGNEPMALEMGEVSDEPYTEMGDRSFANRSAFDPITPFPFNQPISMELILCRICECQIPQWYFEKHSETCVEVHRLEAEIAECNESISELRSTIRDLETALDRSSPAVIPEYRGTPIFSPSTSPSLSPLHLFRPNKIQRMGVKQMQRRLLEQLEDILQIASEIAMPSLKEEEAKEPIERQRLLSPSSERKITQIRNWSKPSTEDAALSQLIQDAERIMRQKVDNVVRMQNTIRYSEKIWREWEEKAEECLIALRESDDDKSDDGSCEDDTTSEYVLTGDVPSSEPTPMASSSPVPFASDSRNSSNSAISSIIPSVARQLQARSSASSSASSPLARAEPIVAPTSLDDNPPPMNLDETPSGLTIKTRRSTQNLLEPKLIITPPHSPLASPHDASTTRRTQRRQSIAPGLFSPTIPPLNGPLSPRLSASASVSRMTPTSIKDFDVIKPISKGAFGSVFLAKKKVTGDYYAIKVLKKADMIAKNQITNVKAERMILMKQAECPFVAKLYFTFQSKENLYLVMEYLNGGDCAALIKSLGSLPEEWAKNYIAEVVLGLEYLHQQGVVHRDLKPDNLLIDQHGHLKLTDFGLSRIGLLGRQTGDSRLGLQISRRNSRSRPPSMDSTYLSSPLFPLDAPHGGSYFHQRPPSVSRPGNSPYLTSTDDVSESSGSESVGGLYRRRSSKTSESPLQSFATELTNDLRSHSHPTTSISPNERKFVGTPDYLAPETILGLRGDDAAVDWWALGVITYEFLYGIPPFHAETPEKVFENILSGHVEWHDQWIEFSPEARDFMQRLMTVDPSQRLGINGAEEVKAHPFFDGIQWDKVTSTQAAFIPQVTDPESTDYFDPRGAIPQTFHDDDQVAITTHPTSDSPGNPSPSLLPSTLPVPIRHNRESSGAPSDEDFGSFSFKNLPVLKQANDEVIRKLKTDQMVPLAQTLSEPSTIHSRRPSVSQRVKRPPNVVTSLESKNGITNPPSPATSATSSVASSPSRASQTPSIPGGHLRKPSEYGALERFKLNHGEGERRNSLPSRLRTASISSAGDGSGSDIWPSSVGHSSGHFESHTPPSSVHSIDLKRGPDPRDRAVTCLLAEDNPITAKIIETLLIRLGCRCVVVFDGSEAISVAMGDIKFDCILMDLHMPVLDGEGAARYIKSTNSRNTNTPIIAISAYSGGEEASNVFVASLSKPLQKAELLSVMRQLGFKTSTRQGPTMHGPGTTKLTTAHITTQL